MENETWLHSYGQAFCLMNWWLFWRLHVIIFKYEAHSLEKCSVNCASSICMQLWQEYVLKTHFQNSNASFIAENKIIRNARAQKVYVFQ